MSNSDKRPGARITLTVQQIIELAEFAGLGVDPDSADDLMRGSEYVLLQGEGAWLEDDDGKRVEYEAIAWSADYPEEGGIGLGAALEPKP
jgi:hypothetical protein